MKELMEPRFKVISDYPNNPWKVGEVLSNPEVIEGMESYPAIFKKLEWWEEREESEMPDYVRNSVKGFVLKVAKHKLNHPLTDEEGICFLSKNDLHCYDPFQPATKEEYEQFKLTSPTQTTENY